jgi:hypothetical protein
LQLGISACAQSGLVELARAQQVCNQERIPSIATGAKHSARLLGKQDGLFDPAIDCEVAAPCLWQAAKNLPEALREQLSTGKGADGDPMFAVLILSGAITNEPNQLRPDTRAEVIGPGVV